MPAHSLATLAKKINEAYNHCRDLTNEVLASAIEAGELLHKAKQQVPHGEWARWVEDNCDFGIRQAQKYMRLHLLHESDELYANANSDSLFNLERTLRAIANDDEADDDEIDEDEAEAKAESESSDDEPDDDEPDDDEPAEQEPESPQSAEEPSEASATSHARAEQQPTDKEADEPVAQHPLPSMARLAEADNLAELQATVTQILSELDGFLREALEQEPLARLIGKELPMSVAETYITTAVDELYNEFDRPMDKVDQQRVHEIVEANTGD